MTRLAACPVTRDEVNAFVREHQVFLRARLSWSAYDRDRARWIREPIRVQGHDHGADYVVLDGYLSEQSAAIALAHARGLVRLYPVALQAGGNDG